MIKPTITINGDNVSCLETFYQEIDLLFTKNAGTKNRYSLNFFIDLLQGKLGVYGYEEPIKLVWANFSSSQMRLGHKLIERLVEIIQEHDHIEFSVIG